MDIDHDKRKLAEDLIFNSHSNALAEFITYFEGVKQRSDIPSKRIDHGILEKTLEFAPGEWLLSSYIATGIENVPIFIKADNAEKEIESFLTRKV